MADGRYYCVHRIRLRDILQSTYLDATPLTIEQFFINIDGLLRFIGFLNYS